MRSRAANLKHEVRSNWVLPDNYVAITVHLGNRITQEFVKSFGVSTSLAEA